MTRGFVSINIACSFALCTTQSPEGIRGTSQPPIPAAGTAYLDIEAGIGKQTFDLTTAGYPADEGDQKMWAVCLPPHPSHVQPHTYVSLFLAGTPGLGSAVPMLVVQASGATALPQSHLQHRRTATSASAGSPCCGRCAGLQLHVKQSQVSNQTKTQNQNLGGCAACGDQTAATHRLHHLSGPGAGRSACRQEQEHRRLDPMTWCAHAQLQPRGEASWAKRGGLQGRPEGWGPLLRSGELQWGGLRLRQRALSAGVR